ncbi:hypothetical protein GN956_G22343 [Arapaima gigas]
MNEFLADTQLSQILSVARRGPTGRGCHLQVPAVWWMATGPACAELSFKMECILQVEAVLRRQSTILK